MKRCFATCAAAIALAIASALPASADATGFPTLTSPNSVFELFPTLTPSGQASNSSSNMTLTLTGSATAGTPASPPTPQLDTGGTFDWIYSGGNGVFSFTFSGVSTTSLSSLSLYFDRNVAPFGPDGVFTASLNGGAGILSTLVGPSAQIAGTDANVYSYTWNTPITAGTPFSIALTSPQNTHIAIDRFQISGVAAVPEPSTYAMMALGAAGLAVFVRRRKLANG